MGKGVSKLSQTIKESEVENQFSACSAWNCNKCGELIAADLGDMKEHLENEHDMEIED